MFSGPPRECPQAAGMVLGPDEDHPVVSGPPEPGHHRSDGPEGRGSVRDQTLSHYATAWKSFTKWLAKDRRTKSDVLADFDAPKVVSSGKRKALTPDQLGQLVSRTRDLPTRRGISGHDRSWLYHLAALTGLRRGELQALTPESFSLDGTPPVVRLPGSDTKNGEAAIQPLPASMIPPLRSWLATRPVDRPLWRIPQNTASLIRSDLEAAGVPSE